VQLSDIANITDRWSEIPDRLYFNGTASIDISVSTTNNEDMILAADITKRYVEDFKKSLLRCLV
jgi:multidrug efflux pump subunit AcrB